MKSYLHKDGRWRHRLRQSWLKEAMLCPERARRDHVGDMPRIETDAACIGTAVHYAIEHVLTAARDEDEVLTFDQMLVVALNHWANLVDQPEFAWVKYNPRSAEKFLTTCADAWYSEVLDSILDEQYQLEVGFCVPFYHDDQRVIELSGTIDYLTPDIVRDWKTSGRGEYEEWEYRRWAIQPTIYTYAADRTGCLMETGEGFVPFEYVVLGTHGAQRVLVERGPEHWSWLVAQCLPLVELIEMELRRWPVVDSHALCSAKWCPAWDTCKGSHGITF